MRSKMGSTDGEAAGIYAVLLLLALAFSYQFYEVGQQVFALLMGLAALPLAYRLWLRIRKILKQRSQTTDDSEQKQD